MQEFLENIWAEPRNRKFITLGGIIVICAILVSGMNTKPTIKLPSQRAGDPQTMSPLGVTGAGADIEKEEVNALVESMNREHEEREKKLADRESIYKKELIKLQNNYAQLQSEFSEVQSTLKTLTQLDTRPMDADKKGNRFQRPSRQAQVQGEQRQGELIQDKTVARQQTNIITQQPIPVSGGNVIRTITQRHVKEIKKSGDINVRDIEVKELSSSTQKVNYASKDGERKPDIKGKNDPDAGEFTLSMGSIISGTSINGVAAPTAVSNQKDPIPILLRVKKEAIMPNYFTIDIRDCHLLGSAIGDLSAERVYIRGEAISCITEDGQAIEKNITAYAVSSVDGMAGIAGTVVHRSGKVIANSMKAGFWGGFAGAAKPNQVNSINTSPTTDTLWQSQNLDRYVGAGILQGASDSLERLSNYYLAIVENTWPVLELLPGEQIDFIVQKGMTLKLEPQKRADLQGEVY